MFYMLFPAVCCQTREKRWDQPPLFFGPSYQNPSNLKWKGGAFHSMSNLPLIKTTRTGGRKFEAQEDTMFNTMGISRLIAERHRNANVITSQLFRRFALHLVPNLLLEIPQELAETDS